MFIKPSLGCNSGSTPAGIQVQSRFKKRCLDSGVCRE